MAGGRRAFVLTAPTIISDTLVTGMPRVGSLQHTSSLGSCWDHILKSSFLIRKNTNLLVASYHISKLGHASEDKAMQMMIMVRIFSKLNFKILKPT